MEHQKLWIRLRHIKLLGLAGTRIFSNLQSLRPDLDLLDVLQRRECTPLALRTAERLLEQRAWTSPSSACRLSTPPGHVISCMAGELFQWRSDELRVVRR
jgi:hypothetical protein